MANLSDLSAAWWCGYTAIRGMEGIRPAAMVVSTDLEELPLPGPSGSEQIIRRTDDCRFRLARPKSETAEATHTHCTPPQSRLRLEVRATGLAPVILVGRRF